MPDTFSKLESDRPKLPEEFLRLGDLRPGSVTAGPALWQACLCAEPNDPGHDPRLRITRGAAGNTITEAFPNPVALSKARQGVAEFHRFRQLSEDLVRSTPCSLNSYVAHSIRMYNVGNVKPQG